MPSGYTEHIPKTRGLLALTARGRKVFADLNARQSGEIGRMIEGIPEDAQENLVAAMRNIMLVLGAGESTAGEIELRAHRPGDMGWVMFTHGVLYAREYAWDERFEALVGEIVVNFIRCIAFARRANYQKLTLWTNSALDAARHIYEANGFRLVSEEEHRSFGHHLTGQYWELDLGDARRPASD